MSTETPTTGLEAAKAADDAAQATYEAADRALADFDNSLPGSIKREGLPPHSEVSQYYRTEGGIKRSQRVPEVGEVILFRVPRRWNRNWLASLEIEVTKVNKASVVGLDNRGETVRVPWVPGEGYTDERGYEVVRTPEEQATHKALAHLRKVAFEAKVVTQRERMAAEKALKEAEQATFAERRQAEREELVTNYLAAYGSRDALGIFDSAESMTDWVANGNGTSIFSTHRRALEVAIEAADFFGEPL